MGNIIQVANCNKRDEYKQKNEKWYKHEPQTPTEKDNITILWDIPVQTVTGKLSKYRDLEIEIEKM